jgi:hypothetical protein
MVQPKKCIQGVIEMRGQILTTRYWLHVELGKNILKTYVKKYSVSKNCF